ncbi:MAG: ABC-type Mn/Zn transport systems, ATPase component [uncultured Nocardioidaceae bacterium]|uniref:ABC-type Mn/Zn transport systems, ATPase component n=1 Tax=uncultured Nocardioidaceae bacterium TaxID=253824 RepID=A0A6J4M0L5_9ACTN|nr:MAG: ABC-type Mn/Zn transport systems, ATPase component [uncultured Nocardioidaceae bacterium]
MTRNTLSRSIHDLGLATWFGGTLANAVALNPAAGEAGLSSRTGAVANVGWDRWTPVNAAAIGLHLAGSLGQLRGNRSRIKGQEGVASMALTKTVLTAAALGVTGYSRVLGKKVSKHTDVPASSGTEPAPSTPPEVANAQRQLALLQWAVPALTGALVVVSAVAGEQQRPSEVKKGVVSRLVP